MESSQDFQSDFHHRCGQIFEHLIQVASIFKHKPNIRPIVNVSPQHVLEALSMGSHRRR